MTAESSGPLAGLRVVELAGIGAAPFCGMILSDLGADVIRVDRVSSAPDHLGGEPSYDLNNRGKSSIAVDMKVQPGIDIVLRLVEACDVLIEGFRPGVMERLGIGPEVCLSRNPGLVYGRMTGWGQEGPLAGEAGHDIDYIALSGVLGAIGDQQPVPPLNLVGDFGGGGLLLAVGILAALMAVRDTGEGQVIDAAMVDGSALLNTATYGFLGAGSWIDSRRSNLLDGGAPFYTVYETSDGGYMAVGALESRFFAALLEGLEIAPEEIGGQHDRSSWPKTRARLAEAFLTRSRAEWESRFTGLDACVTPVLSLSEAPAHPHNVARSTFQTINGVIQPSPAPRFSRTPIATTRGPSTPGRDTNDVLQALGFSEIDIGMLRSQAVVA